MENEKYYDFSTIFGPEIISVLSKRNIISKNLQHSNKITIFSKIMRIQQSQICIPLQTHSPNCKIVDNQGKFNNVDGLITHNPNLVLSLSVADCCPIFIFDNVLKIRGLIHSGWKGTKDKIVLNALEKFKSLGSKISNLNFFLGPSIGDCSYEVQYDVADYFHENCKVKLSDKKYLINIKKQIMQDLIKYGVNEKQIKISEICTFEDENCESFRRDKENSGRMIALFGLKN